METLQRTANRGSISTASYEIDNSCKFEADNSESMARTNSSEGDKQKCTLSVWVKRTELSDGFFFTAGDTVNPWFILGFYQNQFYWSTTAGTSAGGVMQTNRVFRDTSAWYHIVLAIDTTQGTDTNRYKLYVNGIQETSFGTANYPSQNANLQIMDDLPQDVGGYTSYFYCGYIAEFVAIDGSQLAPTEFGEVDSDTGIWIPKDVSGLTFGTNGFHLDFKDASNLGNDASGGTDFTLTNITAADQATDTPTNNFCTFNVVNMTGNTAKLAEGATFTASTANGAFTTYGTMAPSAGKWWWEGKIQVFGDTAYACIGATTNLSGLPSVSAQLSGGHVIKLAKAQKWVLNDTGYSYGAAYADGDIINVGLDLDNRKFYSYKNGTIDDANGIDISSTTFDGFGSQWMPLVITYGSGGASSYEINFGGYRTYGIGSAASDANGYGTFEYAPPSGYYALCTKNLAEFG